MKQARIFLLTIMIALIAGCAGTTAAYKAAEGPEQNAKVVAEHYYALVKEANLLKKSGLLSGDLLVAAQDLVRDTAPAIDSMANAAGAFEATATATTQAELDAAIGKAAIAVSDLIDIIRLARDSSSMQKPPVEPDGGLELPEWFEQIPQRKAA